MSAPLRKQVEQRSGGKVEQHLLDGGYLRVAERSEGSCFLLPPAKIMVPSLAQKHMEKKRILELSERSSRRIPLYHQHGIALESARHAAECPN